MIRGVNQVVLMVDDQERAKKFWSETMGFEIVEDSPYGDERWIAVLTPDGHTRLVLSLRHGDEPTLAAPAEMPSSNVMFYADDVEAAYRELSERGVAFPTPPSKQFFGWWSVFEDSDGTRYALGQKWGTT
jgi:catechol 2,3-dioxygenase-like lactoylglutathione lyase family enzyme